MNKPIKNTFICIACENVTIIEEQFQNCCDDSCYVPAYFCTKTEREYLNKTKRKFVLENKSDHLWRDLKASIQSIIAVIKKHG